MRPIRSILRAWGLAALVVASAGAAVGAAVGAEPKTADALREQFPPASIDSTAKADAALAATVGAKARVEKDFKAAARECLGKVLVNACLDRVRAQQRAHLADIETIELEANRRKRLDKAERIEADRAKRSAERAAAAPADADQRARNRKAYEDKQVEAGRAAAGRTRSNANRAGAPHKPVVRMAAPTQAPDAAKRAKNAADYEDHVKQANEHQQVISRRLVEKAADRKRRADAKAAKEARDAKVAQAARQAAGVPSAASTPGSKP